MNRVFQSQCFNQYFEPWFFRTAADQAQLLTREKPTYDAAEPSGNSVAVHNLLRLHELTTDDRYRVRAERAFEVFGAMLADSPAGVSEMLLAVDFQLDTPKEIVLVVPAGRDDAAPFLAELRARFLPNRILTIVAEGEELERHARVVPLLDGKTARDGRATAYVCENYTCQMPVTDSRALLEQLGSVPDGLDVASRSGILESPRWKLNPISDAGE